MISARSGEIKIHKPLKRAFHDQWMTMAKQSSVLGCLIIVCRLGAEVACTNWNDSRQCGENADGGNQVSPR